MHSCKNGKSLIHAASKAAVQIPAEYNGREQSLLKHRVLCEYLLGWAHKLGSAAQRRRVRLCYVDGFAGPWNSKSENLEDTSIAIGLRALEAAAKTWTERGAKIDVEAAFVEKDRTAFAELDRFLKARTGSVRVTPQKRQSEPIRLAIPPRTRDSVCADNARYVNSTVACS
jgi:hypothetical protein